MLSQVKQVSGADENSGGRHALIGQMRSQDRASSILSLPVCYPDFLQN